MERDGSCKSGLGIGFLGVIVLIGLGLMVGWQLSSLFSISAAPPVKIVDVSGDDEIVHRPLVVESHAEQSSTAPVVDDVDLPQDADENRTWTADKLANYLSQMSLEDFYELVNSEHFDLIFDRSPELYIGLLSGIVDVENKGLKHKIQEILVYQSVRGNQHSAEKFMMDKIRAYDRAPEWLSVLKNWMLEDKESVLFLNDQLQAYSDEQQRSDAITAIASGYGVSELADHEVSTIVEGVAPYLFSSDERVRASAVSAIALYPFKQKEEILHKSLLDDASSVRLAAMRVVSNQHIKPQKIQTAVVDIMLNKSAPALERLTAHQMLGVFSLTDEQHQAAYEFGVNEADDLKRLYFDKQRAEYKESLQ